MDDFCLNVPMPLKFSFTELKLLASGKVKSASQYVETFFH